MKTERIDDPYERSGARRISRLGGRCLERGARTRSRYLYQRRWKAYWITSVLATTWFVAGAVLAQNSAAEAEPQNQLVGLIGLIVLAAVTSVEAGMAVKAVRQDS